MIYETNSSLILVESRKWFHGVYWLNKMTAQLHQRDSPHALGSPIHADDFLKSMDMAPTQWEYFDNLPYQQTHHYFICFDRSQFTYLESTKVWDLMKPDVKKLTDLDTLLSLFICIKQSTTDWPPIFYWLGHGAGQLLRRTTRTKSFPAYCIIRSCLSKICFCHDDSDSHQMK